MPVFLWRASQLKTRFDEVAGICALSHLLCIERLPMQRDVR
jgi:hypothetical protein